MTLPVPLQPVGSYLARSLAERRLIREALVIVVAVRIGLSLLPYGLVRRGARSVRRIAIALRSDRGSLEEISTAVRVAARHVPDATCLTRAITLHLMLLRRGIDSLICLGVSRAGERFAAHAWLEREGRVLIGGGPGPFVPLRRASGEDA